MSQFHPSLILMKAPPGSGNAVSIEGLTVEIEDGYVEVPRQFAAKLAPHGFLEVQARDAAKK